MLIDSLCVENLLCITVYKVETQRYILMNVNFVVPIFPSHCSVLVHQTHLVVLISNN